MIKSQIALIKRELWEHRSLYVTPAVIGILMSLGTVTGQATFSAFDQAVDLAILGGSNLGENERAMAISALMLGVSIFFVIGMWFLTIFYSLDALYAERKDRSILFWRSIPCTDFETVLSKLLTAVFVIPLITLAFIMVTHVIVLIISSVWIGFQGANAGHLIWSAAPLFDNWSATLIFLLAVPLWSSPFIGWFLFISAFTKRAPLMMAVLPLLILPMLEKILIGTTAIAEAFYVRAWQMPLFRGIDPSDFFDEDKHMGMAAEGISMIDLMNLGGFLTSPGLWLGMIVCGLFTTAAIYVRRYRDES
jgi:ABC-2 type transport system permease protein